MFSHIMLGTDDKEKSRAFYNAVLGTLGVAPAEGERLMYAQGGNTLGVTLPANGEPATHANGGTIGFNAGDSAQVDAFHAAGLANGGTCEGEPGRRDGIPIDNYGAYLRDPYDNKICAFWMAKQ